MVGDVPGRCGVSVVRWLRGLELATRPVHPQARVALQRRWAELPVPVRTPAQALGRQSGTAVN